MRILPLTLLFCCVAEVQAVCRPDPIEILLPGCGDPPFNSCAPGSASGVGSTSDTNGITSQLLEQATQDLREERREESQGNLTTKSRVDGSNDAWNIFFSGYFGEEDKDASETAGYSQDHKGFFAGLDYRFASGLVVGGFINSAEEEAEFSDCLGSQDVDEWGGGLIFIYPFANNLSVDFLANYSDRELEIQNSAIDIFFTSGNGMSGQRTLEGFYDNRDPRTLPPTETFDGNADGERFIVSMGIDKAFHFQSGVTAVLRGALEYDRKERDAYSAELPFTDCVIGFEGYSCTTSSDNLQTVKYEDDIIKSLASTLRLDLAKPVSFSNGVLIPQFFATWMHEYKDDPRTITAEITVGEEREFSDGTVFSTVVETGQPDRDYFEVGAGAVVVLAKGVSAFVTYSEQLGRDDYDMWSVDVGVRFEL